VVAAALTLAACGSSSKGAGTAGSKSTGKVADIVWWNMWSGAPGNLTKQMTASFNATHSDIHVTLLNVPSADGDAKLLSAIAAGDPPDVFTEWNPTIGADAATGAIQPMNKYLTGKYAGLEKWMYPVVLDGGLYKSKLYAVPMSMNSLALYYNKSIMKAAGITSPPKTLAQLDSDGAKEWKISGSRLSQIGWYPFNSSYQALNAYYNVKGAGYVNGTYNLAGESNAVAEMQYFARFDKYPYSAVTALNSAYGSVGGGSEDPFSMGKEGFEVTGVWEASTNIPASDPAMEKNFGVEPFPPVPGRTSAPSSEINGNYNIIPKGAKDPQAAFALVAWLAGFDNPGEAKYLPEGGWMPPSPSLATTSDFTSWEKKAPYVKTFVKLMLSKSSQAVPLTSGESEFNTAETTAMENVATKKMTPSQALAYIDKQANGGLNKASG
jgi:multiple sugar transport system substrate-binding protein